MRIALALALTVLRDALRERLLAILGLWLLILLFLTPWIGDLTLGAPTRALRDLGLTLTWLLTCALAIWQGVRAVGGALHDRTAAGLLVRPVARHHWLFGRMIGVGAVLGGVVLGATGALGGTWAWAGSPPTAALGIFAALLWAEAALIASIAALFSLLARPALAAAFTTGLWAAGHLADEYASVAPNSASILFALLPDLDLFSVHEAIIYGDPLAASRIFGALGYAALWIVASGMISSILLSRRDLA